MKQKIVYMCFARTDKKADYCHNFRGEQTLSTFLYHVMSKILSELATDSWVLLLNAKWCLTVKSFLPFFFQLKIFSSNSGKIFLKNNCASTQLYGYTRTWCWSANSSLHIAQGCMESPCCMDLCFIFTHSSAVSGKEGSSTRPNFWAVDNKHH